MKNMLKLLALVAAIVVVPVASAGIRSVTGSVVNGSMTGGAVGLYDWRPSFTNATWTSVSNGAYVNAGTAVTGTFTSGGGILSLTTATYTGYPLLTNASMRGQILGSAYNSNGIFTVTYYTDSTVTIRIWGNPTLSNYGIFGATYFSWSISSSYGTTSGSGEGTDSGHHYGWITVTITPTYAYETGQVQVNADL